jgi:uncharacterized protein YjcR
MGCTEIAKKLGVSLNTVKSWQKRYWKDAESAPKKRTRTHPKGASSKRTPQNPEVQPEKKPNRCGAPKGNVNAVGNHGGAPPGNQNALKHGGWSAVMFGNWQEENRKAIEECTKAVDAEDLLVQELQLLTAREAFLMARIAHFEEKKTHVQMVHTSKSSRAFTRLDEDKEKEESDKREYIERQDAKVAKGERLPGTEVNTSTTVEAGYLVVERLERLLTDVQKQKSKVIQQLADLRRLSNSGKNELVDDWVAAVEAADGAEVEDDDEPT